MGPTHRSFAIHASLTLALLFAGCEARVSLGALCSLTTECPQPYVCRGGRCRTECVEARDCPFPLECMLVGNAGGCRVPEDGACPRGTLDCGPGLECIGGRCAQPCTDHSQCASAQTCVPGGCERVPVEGACDALSGFGCGEGEQCMPEGCVTVTADVTRSADLYGACTNPSECRDGLTCVDGRCLRWCAFEFDEGAMSFSTRPRTSCGAGSFCSGSDTSGGEPAPEGLGYCTQPCNPVESGAAAGCPSTYNCAVSIPSASFGACEPRAVTGGLRHGPCDNRVCAEGLDCVETIYGGPVCLHWCESDADCASGTERCALDLSHEIIDHEGRSRTVALCLPTCDSVLDCPDTLPGMLACDGDCRGS